MASTRNWSSSIAAENPVSKSRTSCGLSALVILAFLCRHSSNLLPFVRTLCRNYPISLPACFCRAEPETKCGIPVVSGRLHFKSPSRLRAIRRNGRRRAPQRPAQRRPTARGGIGGKRSPPWSDGAGTVVRLRWDGGWKSCSHHHHRCLGLLFGGVFRQLDFPRREQSLHRCSQNFAWGAF